MSVWSWIKERWEVLVGFLLGALAIITAIKSGTPRNILRKKTEFQEDIDAAKDKAIADMQSSHDENIENFIEKNIKINKEIEASIRKLDQEKKKKIDKLLQSDTPEDEIAKELGELLK